MRLAAVTDQTISSKPNNISSNGSNSTSSSSSTNSKSSPVLDQVEDVFRATVSNLCEAEKGRGPSPKNEKDESDEIIFLPGKTNRDLIGASPDSIPVIIFVGDFNSLPDSGVAEFMLNGAVDVKHNEFFNYDFPKSFTSLAQQKLGVDHYLVNQAAQNEANAKPSSKFLKKLDRNQTSAGNGLANSGSDKLQDRNFIHDNYVLHPLNLNTAYRDGTDDTPFTNFTYEFKGIIDYIFYSKNNLTLKGRLKGISGEWFVEQKIPGCPFLGFPSDHLCLLAEFGFKQPRGLPHSLQNSSNQQGTNLNSVQNVHGMNGPNAQTSVQNLQNLTNGNQVALSSIGNRSQSRDSKHRDLDRPSNMTHNLPYDHSPAGHVIGPNQSSYNNGGGSLNRFTAK